MYENVKKIIGQCFVCLCLLFVFAGYVFADDEQICEEAQFLWRDLKGITVIVPDGGKFRINHDDTGYVRMRYYWETLQSECEKKFFEYFALAVKNNRIEKFARDFVSYFGKEGDAYDMRWALACPILATNNRMLAYEGNDKKISKWEFNADFKLFACEFRKAVVVRAISSREAYFRMYWFTMWSADFPMNLCNKNEFQNSIGMTMDLAEEGFRAGESDHKFWGAIRDTLVIAYLCGQEYIFINMEIPLKTEDLYERIKTFGTNFRMLSRTHMVYSRDEVRYVPCDRLPPFELPSTPFPRQPDSPTSKLYIQYDLPKNVGILTPDFFMDVNMFNAKFRKKVMIEKPLDEEKKPKK